MLLNLRLRCLWLKLCVKKELFVKSSFFCKLHIKMMSININSFMLILRKIAEIDTFNGSWNSGGIKLSQSN